MIFLKTLNPAYPLSGLLSFPWAGERNGRGVSRRRLPSVDVLGQEGGSARGCPEAVALPELELTIRLGKPGVPRTAFLRGEMIPLEIEVANRKGLFGGT